MLPEMMASSAEGMQRFEREAKALAALNHPNVAGIHQVEHDGGVHFLVMELAEGQTLGQRIGPGRHPQKRLCASPCRSPRGSRRRTIAASSIATSNPPT